MHRIRLRKRWGQNFLINPGIGEKIIRAANLTDDDIVLEIGPGLGALTSKIAPAVSKLIAVEIDPVLAGILKERLADYKNLMVVEEDFLKCNLDNLLNTYSGVKVIANLPYYITTPVITHLLKAKEHFCSLTIMVQKEVGERILASPGSKKYGALSVFVQFHSQIKLVSGVSKNSFFPPPKVDSVVLNLIIRQIPAIAVEDEGFFFQVVRAGFGTRRKMLINALVEGGIGNKNDLRRVFDQIEIDPQRRAEELSLEEFARLSQSLKQEV